MILEFSVENFKSIKDKAVISFEATNDSTNIDDHSIEIGNKKILKMAMILGPNASGKTNILLALNFFRNYIANSFNTVKPAGKTGFIPFLFDNTTKDNPGKFEIVFYIEGIRYEYNLHVNADIILFEELSYAPKGQKKLLYKRDLESDHIYSWGESLTGNRKDISGMTRENIPYLTTAAQLNHDLLSKVYDWFSNQCLPIELPLDPDFMKHNMDTISLIENDDKMKNRVLELLASADLSHISDIEVKKKEIESSFLDFFSDKFKNEIVDLGSAPYINEIILKHKYNETDNLLSLKQESKGTQRFFELCGPLIKLMETHSVLPIDELDSSLHQEVFNLFIKTFLLKSSGAQLIFTCHNLDILDTDLVRKDEIWLCEKDNMTGGSIYSSISDFKGIRKGQSLRKSYLSGQFGARPITDIIM